MLTTRLRKAAIAGALIAVAGLAHAAGSLTIQPTLPTNHPGTSATEAAGQASGTSYPWPGGPGAGAGIPSSASGWPVGPGFAQEPGFAKGTSGFDTSYLQLNRSGWVTFQFMGGGDSGLQNSFWVDLNGPAAGGWTQLFEDSHAGSPTDPCPTHAVGSAAFPACDKVAPGLPNGGNLTYNQYTIYFPAAGLLPFAFDLDGSTGSNANDPVAGPINAPGVYWHNAKYAGASGNPADDSLFPGFFLGLDPYLATGKFQLTGNAVYAGLSDQPRPGDHDYQDMVVRISTTPEPGSLLLLGAAVMGLVAGLRRPKT